MDILIQVLIFVLALAALLKGSDWFIDSAESIGLNLGISPFVIGVTIVAFGTSLPELATSISSVLQGESDVVIGNVVGSNITNIALVLGVVAVTVKLIRLEYNIWHIDMPFVLASALFLWFSVSDGDFSIAEAVIFCIALILFLSYTFSQPKEKEEDQVREKISLKTWALLIIGGLFVWLGADFTIRAISTLSQKAGISSEIIALTGIALGTSLPELMVSLNAAKKGKTSIAVGNVLGSNIFNTFFVMAIPRFFGELEISQNAISFTLPFMIAITIMFAIITNNKKISKWEGMLMLVFYAFFLVKVIGLIGN